MSNPMSSYSYSRDSRDFLQDYKEKVAKDQKLKLDQDIVQQFGEDWERAYSLLNTYYAEAYKDLSYYLSNQWSLEELSYLNNQRRSSFTYNKIKRLMDLVQGYQRKNRLSTIVSPIEDASSLTAEIQTDVLQYIMQFADGYEVISEAFKGACTTGLSFVSPWIDYRSDPISGDIRFHHDAWNAIVFDPFFTKKDLTDCSFIARRKFLSRTEVISLLPDKQDIIERLPWGTRDDKFTYMPYARQWGMQKLLNYTEYWRTKWETKDVLVDMESGETMEWKGDKQRLRLYRQQFPQIEVMKKPVRSVELGIIVEGQLLSFEKNPNGLTEYPFVPFFWTFEPSYDLFEWKIQSGVRILRDPQTEINKRRSKMVDIIDNQLSSGWKAKTNAVSNPASLYKSGQNQVIWMKPEAQMEDAQRLQAPEIPNSMFQLEQEFEKDLFEVLGLSPENVGMAENDRIETAAILAKARQAAGWMPLQNVFDGLRESQRILGRKTMQLFQHNYTPEKIKLITKKDPTPEFYSKAFARYDVVIEEGVLTDTQKQSNFMQLLALKSMNMPIPDSLIIKNSNLHGRKELEEMMAQQSQAQAQKEQVAQQVELQRYAAETEADKALAAERINKVGLDAALNVERISRAEEDRTAGVLNLVKAMKEIESIDISSLRERLALLKDIEAGQRQEEQKPTEKIQQASPNPSESAPQQVAM